MGGIVVAAVTPRRANEYSIDLAATLELVDFLCAGGVNGIALLGSTGEFPHFALDDRRHMLDFAAKRSRLPLLVNVSASTLDTAVELAQEAAGSGVAGVMLMPPYYFRYSQETIRAFFLSFAERIQGRIPVYLYNIPVFTNGLAIETAVDLLATGAFAGIKDSSGGWDYFTALREQCARTPFTILIGHEPIYAKARAEGAHGAVSGAACAIPELMVALERAIGAGDSARVRTLDCRVREFITRIEPFPAPTAIKEATRLRKQKTGVPALPLGASEARAMAEFGEWFRGWLPAVLRECGEVK
jgi:dihydrodipicolinate synthase/N-acetylneuraminate lyase